MHFSKYQPSVVAAAVVCMLSGCGDQTPKTEAPQVAALAPDVSTMDDIDLSPASWPDGVLLATLDRNSRMGESNGLARGSQGVIAGTTGAPAIQAGLEALKQGGNAIDAVITTSLAQISLAGGAWVSYAGIFELMYFDASTGIVFNLNAGYNSVLAEDDPATIPAEKDADGKPTPSGRTALVPGYFAGINAAHENFGSIPLRELFEPAIYLAEQGFPLHSIQAGMIERRKDVLSRLPATKAIFTGADGDFLAQGDILKQPELANTLKIVASLGIDYIYQGPWAERFVEAIRADGGKMTLEDMRRYEVIWQDPIKYQFDNYTLYLHGRPGLGGTHLVESLNLVKASGLLEMGDYRVNPEAFYWFSQFPNTFAISFIPDSVKGMVFPGLNASLEDRLTTNYADALWQMIRDGDFVFAAPPCVEDPKHSDAIVVIDRWGNMAAVTHTINTGAWGGTGIFVDGISIPDSAAFQQSALAEIQPGERLPDPTEPLLVFRDGKPLGAFSSIGAGLHQKTFTVLLNLIGYGSRLEGALGAPSTHLPQFDVKNYLKPPTTQVVAGEFNSELLAAARELGLDIKEFGASSEDRGARGYVVGAVIGSDGQRVGGSTRLFNAPAKAY